MAFVRPNLIALLHRHYPRVYRIAFALCGDQEAALSVVENVIIRSGPISPRWETADQATRWFLHYTVLLTRQCAAGQAQHDALLHAAGTSALARFIVAIRNLPQQQREAFLLHHGERLDLRQVATTMDCSSAAAANHLVMATASLNHLGPAEMARFTAELPGMMQKLVPGDHHVGFEVQRILQIESRRRWTRRLLLALLWGMVAIILLVLAGLAWRFHAGL